MFDYHVHSEFSGDCTMPMEKAIQKAISLGLKEMAFTDHIDFDYPDPDFQFYVNYDEYLPIFLSLKNKYQDQIILRLGIEIGTQPHLHQINTDLLKKYPFDFILASTHTVQRQDLHFGQYFKNKTAHEATMGYYQDVLNAVQEFDYFSVYGHIDLVKRYQKFYNITQVRKTEYWDIMDQILIHLIHHGKGIEINSSGFRYGIGDTLPDIELLKRFKELGGEIVTTGSDAHCSEHIGDHFKIVYEMIKNCGFRYVATFEQLEPIMRTL